MRTGDGWVTVVEGGGGMLFVRRRPTKLAGTYVYNSIYIVPMYSIFSRPRVRKIYGPAIGCVAAPINFRRNPQSRAPPPISLAWVHGRIYCTWSTERCMCTYNVYIYIRTNDMQELSASPGWLPVPCYRRERQLAYYIGIWMYAYNNIVHEETSSPFSGAEMAD